jgi:hypothetical protein
VAGQDGHRVWTAVITVAGYNPMVATWSDRDEHDDQIMQAAHDALRLMRAGGAEAGVIDLFKDTQEHGNEHVEQRTVSIDEHGIVVSANLRAW